MSSQLQVSGEAKIRDIQGPVVANSGVITALDGAASQYVRGDGTLADFPTSTGGGSSVSYYLNSSVSQGTIGGVAYRELSKEPIIGAGTDIAISTTGYVASYLTDANDPDVLSIPGGNFNCEFYFSVNNNTGNPFFYAELYKYDGTTFTLLGSNVGVPEYINQGTIITPYYFAIPVATSALALTDRLAIRIYVNVSGRTITLHTENGHLCQVVTTLSKGMVSLNNLTDQSQFITTGTSGTNFAIVSSGDTHTFNLPIASATNTGKLSSTDWSTFNNKQNTITDPITGTGASTQIAYFNSGTSITSEAAFNYDASTNRLGVNTSVPNATIGANAGTDSGYSLLLKNDNANYNGIGFGTDSTYGNLISTEKLGTAPARNLTLLNQSGYISITELGNLGVNILSPNTGLDIYNGTSAFLWLHTANSGITGTDGVRLALFSTNTANLRNYEGAFSITAEGDFSIITIGAENFRVNSADGSIYQSKVANALLKSVSGVITAAVANTDYQSPISLTTSGSSGAATFISNTLNVPNYTLAGLGGVPTSRTLTINGTAFDLSADRSWTVGTMGGSGTSGQVAYFNGTNSITSEGGFIYDASTNRLGVNTSVPNATIGADSALDSGYGLLIKTGASNYNGIGIAIDSTYGNLISTEKLGSASARNLTLLNQSGFVSLKENGNFGVNTLNPAVSGTGIDVYSSTSTGIRFHTANSGTTVSDGAGINFSAANNLGITNYENGTIDIVTNGNSGVFVAANGFVGINGATPSVALTVNGGAAISNLTTGQIVFPTSGGTLAGSSNLFWDNSNIKLAIGTSSPNNGKLTIVSNTDADHLNLIANAPALSFGNALIATYGATIGMATASNNFFTGAVQGDLAIGAFNTSNIYFYNPNTNTIRMSINGSGAAIFSGSVTGRGAKSQIVVDGNSVGCGISLSNSLVGANRRNWGIFTEENVEGDFVIKRSTTAGASPTTNVLSLSRDGAATFSSNVGVGGYLISTNQVIANNTITSPTTDNTLTNGTVYAINGISTNNNFGIGLASIRNSAYDIWMQTGSVNGGGYRWYIGTSEKMTMSSTGNVGIGTSSPTGYGPTLQIAGTSAQDASFVLGDGSGTTTNRYLAASPGSSGNFHFGTNTGDILIKTGLNPGTSVGTERMRITSGGFLKVSNNGSYISSTGTYHEIRQVNNSQNTLIFSNTGADPYGVDIQYNNASPNNATNNFLYCVDSTTLRAAIRSNGGLANYSGNNVNLASDRRLKKDIVPLSNEWNNLKNIEVVKFRYKDSNEETALYGAIAQQVQEIYPELVVITREATENEPEYYGLREQPFQWLTTKVLQEAMARIEEQQAQIEELKELIKNK
jgi:hypothetical protein